jgi:fibro-slime domain-containing protein
MRLHRLGVGLALVTAVGALANCGARTGLDEGEACPMSGATRPCEGFCGAGLQTCDMGFWQACVVPETTRACTNACGAGTQECIAEAWQSCVVPDATRACTNACGSGTQLCTAGAWQSCVVAPTMLACSTICGSGNQPCVDNTPGACDAPQPHDPILSATFLDFRSTQPDFEGTGIPPTNVTNPPLDMGIVESALDSNNLPVYAGDPTTLTTTGKQDFDVWYRSTPGINESFSENLTMMPAANPPGYFSYENQAFFLLDNQGFGNETELHNFDFTMSTESSFIYKGGETFAMASDDDSWLFLNRRLAIDLGGLHDSQRGTVALDAVAGQLGLVVGTEYPLDVFYAERHVTGAVFSITCTIAPRHQCD